MQYSVPRDQRQDGGKSAGDWICAKCGAQNFRRRDACFKCQGSRTQWDASTIEPGDELSSHPTATVLLSGLDTLTTEDSVLATLGPLTTLPLKSVRIGRDNLTSLSRGVCFVEMNSVVDSMFLHNQLLANQPVIDGKVIEVGYHKAGGLSDPRPLGSGASNAAANSALAAAQWTNKSSGATEGPGSVCQYSETELMQLAVYSAGLYAKTEEERRGYIEYYKKYYREGGDATAALAAIKGQTAALPASTIQNTVVVDGVEYKKFPPPDTSKYQYDETSGYYYDKVSTLYYDTNSQYYFNSKTNKFCYWSSENETFLPAPEGEKEDKGKEKEKAKSAKKIQKDMEKWARKLEIRKEKEQSKAQDTQAPQPPVCKGTEDLAFIMLQRKQEKEGSSGLGGLQGYGSEEEETTQPEATVDIGVSVAELELTDWEKLACLLCCRQFQTREKLQKHNTMSDLHQKNLEDWRGKQGGGSSRKPVKGQDQDDQEEQQYTYKDRAKERRKKFGPDDSDSVVNKFKDKYMRVMDEAKSSSSAAENAPKLDENNVGNRMLQKMGWKDGLGLGKKNQGRTENIEVTSRMKGTGLGVSQPSLGANDSYADITRKAMWSRFNDGQ